jgi:hypothetical protein
MTNAKKKKPAYAETETIGEYTLRQTPDALVISQPPQPLLSSFFFVLFGVPLTCMLCFTWVFALVGGDVAPLTLIIFTLAVVFIVGSMFLGGVNTTIIMVTREAIFITSQPLPLSKKQTIDIRRVGSINIVEYEETESIGEHHSLEFVTARGSVAELFSIRSRKDAKQLKMHIERFLGISPT